MFREEKAQVSAEMLIVLAALVAVAIILVMQLQKTAEKGSAAANSRTDRAIEELNAIGK